MAGSGDPALQLRAPRIGTWRQKAFSLLEVIIAVGLFATTVSVLLALLPGLTRQGTEIADRQAALRLPDALRVELGRLSANGFDALAGQVPVMDGPPADGLALVADRGGSRLHSLVYQPPASGGIAEAEQFFLVECWRFPDEPLAYAPEKAYLAVAVRVSWPYRLPGLTVPTPESTRSSILFTTAINR